TRPNKHIAAATTTPPNPSVFNTIRRDRPFLTREMSGQDRVNADDHALEPLLTRPRRSILLYGILAGTRSGGGADEAARFHQRLGARCCGAIGVGASAGETAPDSSGHCRDSGLPHDRGGRLVF